MYENSARNGFSYNKPNVRQAGTVMTTEQWWRDRYNVIAEQGYRLSPRYHPQWGPSWLETGKDLYTSEGGQVTTLRGAMDAIRIRDGCPVILKEVIPHERPHELRINQLFSSAEHSRMSDNHCAPLLGVIELPRHFESQKLMVFPLLHPFNGPRIQTFGEFSAFFTQICEGVQFMHQRSVSHRDCTADNIKVTAAQRPPRYYFINFSLARQYPSRDAMDEPLSGGDESAPEHQSGRLCNPFHTDIYYIGNLVRKEFTEKCYGFEFIEELVTSMTQDDPAKRPLIEDILHAFFLIRSSLSKSKLRSAIISKNAPKVFGIIRQARQSVRTLRYIMSGHISDAYS
ncbi:hypothetical protein EDB89DRAFT_1891407 [Lactarius sanguifluus]|nr:hypothetical protein EDB89DRAFT_1891407 [Lactarius sanguifluus]